MSKAWVCLMRCEDGARGQRQENKKNNGHKKEKKRKREGAKTTNKTNQDRPRPSPTTRRLVPPARSRQMAKSKTFLREQGCVSFFRALVLSSLGDSSHSGFVLAHVAAVNRCRCCSLQVRWSIRPASRHKWITPCCARTSTLG